MRLRLRLGLAVVIASAASCGHAHPGVRYLGPAPWSTGRATHCAYCGGGETAEVVVERVTPGGRETLSVEFESCIPARYDTVARVVHVRHVEGADDELVADSVDVPIEVIHCDREGPIHVRFRDRLGGESIRFDVRIEHPATSEGFE